METKLKRIIKRIINLTPLPVWYAFDCDLSSLRRKINWWNRLSPGRQNIFAREITFLNSVARVSDPWNFIFPYPFVNDTPEKSIAVFRDEETGLLYVLHNGRKLFYSRTYSDEKSVRDAYMGIWLEQNARSPHCYTGDGFNVEENDTVIDIGAAEGNFSLDVVERAGIVYIIEPDEGWIEALRATFRPWKNKVEIINKFASDVDGGNCVSLQGLLGDKRVNFIKMDVGGAESRIIESSAGLLAKNPSVRLAVCTYHRKEDAGVTERLLTGLGFTCSFTAGFMLYIFNNLTPPYFRKTLIRARKEG